jgi:ubiquinone biosynthesis protein
VVPRVDWNLTSAGVLALERIDGIPIYAADDLARAGADRKALALHLAECFLEQYFELGLFHSDPHPGNLVVQPPDRIGILDFGQVGRMADAMRARLGTALIAALNREFDVVLDVLDDLEALPDDFDQEAMKNDLAALVDKYAGVPLKRLDIRVLFEDITAASRRHGVLLPRDFVLLGKSLAIMGGVVLDLDPETSMVELVQPRVRALMRDKVSPERLVHQALTGAYHVATMLEQAPRQLRQLARKINRGRLQIVFRHENLDRFITELDRSSNRIAFSAIVASIILGSSVLMQAHVKPLIPGTDIPLLGMLGYVVAGLLGVWLVFAILRSGRL